MFSESAKAVGPGKSGRFTRQVNALRCLCIAVCIGTSGCGRAPTFPELAKKATGGMGQGAASNRFFWDNRHTATRQIGDQHYLTEKGVYARAPNDNSGGRTTVWLCFVSDNGYWGDYRLRAVRADENDANRIETQKALDALFAGDPEMTWQSRISQQGPPADPTEKLKAFKAVLAQFKRFPDRFAADSERTAFNKEADALVKQFIQCPFDARANPSTARAIVELFESQVENKYSGDQVGLIEDCVRRIYIDSIDR